MYGNQVVTTKYKSYVAFTQTPPFIPVSEFIWGLLGGDLLCWRLWKIYSNTAVKLYEVFSLLFLPTPSQVLQWKETNNTCPGELTIFW